ncbi:DUF3604 domain-containing protein, partial [candidate division KSB1 bacterium]|nr:DUF3604 domain-containing protein [candidate division KSB1 bacterium]NIX69671.1 DUF3604 domain-containing protein [candidate division KSB1 bacterium]
MTVGSFQNILFEIDPGSARINTGGGFRLELPVSYLETEPYFWDRPQTDLPEARGYVEVRSSGGATLQTKLYGRRGGIIEAFVEEGALQPGERLSILYAGVVQSLDWPLKLRVEWRSAANEPWQRVGHVPEIVFLPQEPATLTAVAPADLQKDVPFDLAVVLLDKFGNRASRYRGTITLTATDSLTQLPGSYTFTQQDSGVHIFRGLAYHTPGFQRIDVSDGTLKTQSNYSLVSTYPLPLKRFFGDTHFHTGTGADNLKTNGPGGDHRGNYTRANLAYKYVRDVIRLDFASSSEHDIPQFDETVWQKSQTISNDFYQPGKFTTFFAYEWTAPIGHHVVSYKDTGNAIFSRHQYDSLLQLWQKLDEQGAPAVTIPHVTWPTPDHGIWKAVNNRYRKIGEIYSLWNNRFLLQPADDPQRFELGGDWSYQHAWANGHKIGVIGSSDNHTGHPGANNYTAYTQHTGGLAVALAPQNNRENIWAAYQQRRTYATTGMRIYLDFSSDGHPMGAEYSTNTAPHFAVNVAGTNTIETVEIIKYDGQSYNTIYTDTPGSEISVFEFTDEAFSGDSFYYVRVKQVDEYWRSPWSYTTREMAWSSPIWINLA